ncbi:MAG: hypothetical protein K2N44_12560 [Lachnospiraceae bacterium]|nr:hypothetical protein [Lachnospiraceae bacterium]
MVIRILHKGDTVLNVTKEFIAVRRKNGEVDLIGLLNAEGGVRIDIGNIVTIGFGDNVVETETENGVIISNF